MINMSFESIGRVKDNKKKFKTIKQQKVQA